MVKKVRKLVERFRGVVTHIDQEGIYQVSLWDRQERESYAEFGKDEVLFELKKNDWFVLEMWKMPCCGGVKSEVHKMRSRGISLDSEDV